MKNVFAILTLATMTVGPVVAAHAAHPTTSAPRVHVSATHDRTPKPHIKAAAPHK